VSVRHGTSSGQAITSIVLAMVLAFAGTATALGAEPPDDIPDGMAWDPVQERLLGADELLEQDAVALAEAEGWSLDYARARLLTSLDTDAAMAEVARLRP
jgi:hypothetical protein